MTVNGVNTPSSSSPPPPPPWLDVLLGLEMTDFAGDGEAARAAVIVGEVREMEDKELMLLRRLHKVGGWIGAHSGGCRDAPFSVSCLHT